MNLGFVGEDNLGFADNSKFCGDCEYLNYTEKEQEIAFGDPDHKCMKYNKRVLHYEYHPRLLKCDDCLNN